MNNPDRRAAYIEIGIDIFALAMFFYNRSFEIDSWIGFILYAIAGLCVFIVMSDVVLNLRLLAEIGFTSSADNESFDDPDDVC